MGSQDWLEVRTRDGNGIPEGWTFRTNYGIYQGVSLVVFFFTLRGRSDQRDFSQGTIHHMHLGRNIGMLSIPCTDE